MGPGKKIEQQIAVFGEAGSGKTVLVSSFYGATQEPDFLEDKLFHVIADDQGQGNQLHSNYLSMRNSAKLPQADRFSGHAYSFTVKLRSLGAKKGSAASKADALKVVWHDYPGEWFEEGVSGDLENRRRLETFRALLGSDVAFLLVDAQRLIDQEGEEERYLKLLFTNFRNGLLALKDDLLADGDSLVQFPRIWIVALSKADLLPDIDVFQFRDLVIEKAAGEIHQLREVLRSLVSGDEALDLGQDFVLLSSAKFEPGKIHVSQRRGVDLILPIAAVLPFERYARWAERLKLPSKVLETLLRGAGPIALGLTARSKRIPRPLGLLLKFVGTEIISEAAGLAADRLAEYNAETNEKGDALGATLSRFKMDLEGGEEDRTLLRSKA